MNDPLIPNNTPPPSSTTNQPKQDTTHITKRSKHDQQLDTLVNYLTNPQVNGNRIYLYENILKTRYVVWDFQIVFWEENVLVELIKSNAYFQTSQNLNNSILKSALQIILSQRSCWIFDTELNRIIPTRVICPHRGSFIYIFNQDYYATSGDHINPSLVRIFASNNFREIDSPKNPHFLNELGFSSNYNPQDSLNFLKENLFKSLNISEDYFLIILTWLIQSIVSDNYTLLELIGESKSGKSYVQSVLRELIDPNFELFTELPKKLKDLKNESMKGHVMSFDNVEEISEEIQLFMVNLMSNNGVRISIPSNKNGIKFNFFVRRPIILNSLSPVVTHEKLLSKSLTLELKPSEKKWHEYQEVYGHTLDTARQHILKLSAVVFKFHINEILPRCTYKDLHDFSNIGLRLSYILFSTTVPFKNQFNSLVKEQSLAKLEENHTSYLTYLWAKENTNTQKEFSAISWISNLEKYHDISFGEWKVSPKQFGSDLKKVAPVLREFGINCESLGKRGSYVKWKITTAEIIDIQTNFFEMPEMPETPMPPTSAAAWNRYFC